MNIEELRQKQLPEARVPLLSFFLRQIEPPPKGGTISSPSEAQKIQPPGQLRAVSRKGIVSLPIQMPERTFFEPQIIKKITHEHGHNQRRNGNLL
jgi:hypothetical protein